MTQKMTKKNEFNRATLTDIGREMAKPRLAESVREAAEIAEQEARRVQVLHGPKRKSGS